MGDLTENFSRKEFTCKCGCGLDCIDVGAVNRLQVFRDILQEPIYVNSGCRCPAHNEKVGGGLKSLHLEKNGCKAVDWTIKDREKLRRFGMFMDGLYSGGWHYYEMEKFIHSDVGGKQRW